MCLLVCPVPRGLYGAGRSYLLVVFLRVIGRNHNRMQLNGVERSPGLVFTFITSNRSHAFLLRGGHATRPSPSPSPSLRSAAAPSFLPGRQWLSLPRVENNTTPRHGENVCNFPRDTMPAASFLTRARPLPLGKAQMNGEMARSAWIRG